MKTKSIKLTIWAFALVAVIGITQAAFACTTSYWGTCMNSKCYSCLDSDGCVIPDMYCTWVTHTNKDTGKVGKPQCECPCNGTNPEDGSSL